MASAALALLRARQVLRWVFLCLISLRKASFFSGRSALRKVLKRSNKKRTEYKVFYPNSAPILSHLSSRLHAMGDIVGGVWESCGGAAAFLSAAIFSGYEFVMVHISVY